MKVKEILKQIKKKYPNEKDQLLTKLHSYLVKQKSTGHGDSEVTNVEMLNLINKYL